MKPGLASLISPFELEHFLTTIWPSEPFVAHDLSESISTLTQLPFLQSLEALLHVWPGTLQAHLPDVSDEASSVDVFPADARKLFANKMSLLFNNVEKLHLQESENILSEWLYALRSDLGLPAMTYGRCMIYATPDGKGTAPHFDQNVNFVVQIHGTKKWWLAPNRHVENPTQRHTMGLQIDPELTPYSSLPMPTAMPADSLQVVLKPGSVLFVPRGYWHSTEANGNALALNFTFNQPTWIDLFSAALRSRLSMSPEWRELANGVSSKDPERREFAQQRLDILLLELTSDLPNWQAAEILGATEGL